MQLGEKWNQNKTTISIKIQFSHSHKNHLTQNTNMKSGWTDALIKNRNQFQINRPASYHANGKCLPNINPRK